MKKIFMSITTMSLLTVAAVLSLRNLPSEAEYGYSVIFYLIMAAICFFVPSALVSAELASSWPEDGGVYLWVKEAFGPKWGFVAVFMQWVENLPWFPAVLTFVASSIAYVFNPAWAQNRWFVLITIWVMLWLATFLNFKGMRLSAWLSSSGALAGTLIPGAVIILMAIGYIIAGKTPQIAFSSDALIPDLGNWNQLMLLSGMMVALAGMEMSAIHVTEMKNPGRDFPKAIFAACILVILLNVLGALAIALVIPPGEISLAAGADQAFAAMFRIFDIPWMTPIMCFLLSYGALTMVVTWVLGPSKGVLEVAKDGYLPELWQRRNKAGMPTNILIIQAVISSLLALVVLFMPTISGAFWLMSALTAQLYMVMYLLMFAAAIKLRYSKPDIPRAYKVPGGKVGMWLVSGVAFLTSLFAIITGFIPTPGVREKGTFYVLCYIAFLLIGTIVFIIIPLWLYKHSQKNREAAEKQDQQSI